MKTVICKNMETASRLAADLVCDQIEKKPNSVLLLATGSSPLRMYELLAEKVKAGQASLAEVKTFNLDEYFGIDKKNPQSYHSYMWNNFFSKIDIKKENVEIPETNPKDERKFCKEYEKKIKKAGIDLAVLGIGRNGHIAFNEPGTSFESETHAAELTAATAKANSRFFKSEKEVPKKAITVGLKTIMGAKEIVLLAFGKQKAKAVGDAVEGKVTKEVPASVLQKHKNAIFILDREAASMLRKN